MESLFVIKRRRTKYGEFFFLEKIEASYKLGGYRRCRYYSVVRYTIVNRFRRIFYRQGQGLVAKKSHGPVCMRERGA
jgi:hypothetical protein